MPHSYEQGVNLWSAVATASPLLKRQKVEDDGGAWNDLWKLLGGEENNTNTNTTTK